MRQFIALFLVASLGIPSIVLAQTGDAAASEKAAAATKKVGTSQERARVIEQFKAAEARNEELRYKHLWIAYAMVWIVIFTFVFRTWKLNNKTSDELALLKSRLAKLESSDDT
ncbi:MAG: hypothetical protein VYA30_04060 [Myxococcota bacterium]|nr:hypothetical protein [Myxococcota bacterium]